MDKEKKETEEIEILKNTEEISSPDFDLKPEEKETSEKSDIKPIEIKDRGQRHIEKRKNERKNPRRSGERAKQEFDNKIISVRRVTRVTSGGRRFSFAVSIIIGDKKGRVGVGTGKALDTPIAVDKAVRSAKKNLIKVILNERNSIMHPTEAKYSSARISLIPSPGKGVVAGSAVRIVLELAGIKEVSSKILSRSKNKLNIAKATIKALSMLKTAKPKKIQ